MSTFCAMCIRFHLVLFRSSCSCSPCSSFLISLFFFLVRRIHYKSSLGRRVVYDWIEGLGIWVCRYERRLMYWWDGGGEDEKGLIVMFTIV